MRQCMNIILCIDDENGMLFHGRRQSKDRVLRQQVRALAQGHPLWMNSYTARQFSEDQCETVVNEAFLENAPEDAWCFVENCDLQAYTERIQRVVLYRWNRRYPSDVKFPMELFADKWSLISTRNFPGSSHEKITEEVYHL